MRTILLVNGPNLGMLGKRDPAQYGSFSLADVEKAFAAKAAALGFGARFFQSDCEGELCKAIHAAKDRDAGIVINAGAYTHYSYAILDALSLAGLPVMEVHISDIHKREAFRHVSVIQPACVGQVCGLGFDSYMVGLERLVKGLGTGDWGLERGGRGAVASAPQAAASEAQASASAPALSSLREAINSIDAQLIALFNSRMNVAKQIAAEKAVTGSPVYDAAREAAVSDNAAALSAPETQSATRSLMRSVMRLSRGRQYDLLLPQLRGRTVAAELPERADADLSFVKKVSYGGAVGSYSEKASRKLFPDAEHMPAWSFAEACRAVQNGEADAAVLPLANTAGGSVDTVYKLLRQNMFVARRADLAVSHVLCALPGAALDGVKTALSHPQALSQCAAFIAARGLKTIAVENTAYAPAEVAKKGDPSLAAICSAEAAAANGLEILARGICDHSVNDTRFVAVTKRLVVTADASCLGIIMDLSHTTGSLSSALEVIADRGLNLASISAQPVPDRPWEYSFFLDIAAPALDPAALAALCQLSSEFQHIKIVGWYGETNAK